MSKEPVTKNNSTKEVSQLQKRIRELEKINKKLQKDAATRNNIEKDLKASEYQLKILFEDAPDAIFLYDFQGILMDGNPAAEKLTGYTREELIGKKIAHLHILPENQIPRALRDLAKTAMGKPTEPEVYTLNRKDDSQVTVEICAYPVQLKNTTLALGIARDITKRKFAEEEKTKLHEQLRQAHKMDAIGRLAGGIAHDFNNKLGAISGYADMIRSKFGKSDSKLEKYAKGILDAARKSADLTSKLVAFARKGKYEIGPINIHETIHNVIELLKHSIDKRVKIVKYLQANPSTVIGDHTQLQNAILNLAMNAQDVMPNEGELKIETENVNLTKKDIKDWPYEIKTGIYLKISISDTGPGMDDEVKANAFEPFFTTKSLEGAGLGLSVVYGTVKAHNGFIEIVSETGRGTTVEVYLPLAGDEESRTTAGETIDITKNKGNILLVDDEDIFRDMTVEMLEDLGYTPFTCNDGQEAVEFFQKNYNDIDLIILDLVMPRLGGADCFVELKKINPAVRVVVSSGYSRDGEAKQVLDNGALSFLQKPFNMKGLSQAITKALSVKIS
jgi:PAS domain S-box-containing protein